MVNLGDLEAGQGQVKQARDWYRDAIGTQHPDQAPRAMVNLGILESRRGGFDEDDSWLSKAEATGHPKQAPRARAAREEVHERRAMLASLPYLSPGNESQTPYIPVPPPSEPGQEGPHSGHDPLHGFPCRRRDPEWVAGPMLTSGRRLTRALWPP